MEWVKDLFNKLMEGLSIDPLIPALAQLYSIQSNA